MGPGQGCGLGVLVPQPLPGGEAAVDAAAASEGGGGAPHAALPALSFPPGAAPPAFLERPWESAAGGRVGR